MDAAGNSHQNSSPGSAGFNFSTPSVQNQIHELAKTLPPPRKQNTACDACRSRKVKCNQLPGQDKCQHCQAKNYPCTHYVQQMTSEKKRNSSRKPRTLGTPTSSVGVLSPGPTRTHADSLSSLRASPYPLPNIAPPQTSYPTSYFYPQNYRVTLETPTKDLLAYIFSPPDPSASGHINGQSRYNSGTFHTGPEAYAEWGESAYKLEDDKYRAEIALDLVEVFFQIVHTRLPLLNPTDFRDRLLYALEDSASSQFGGIASDLRRSNSPNTPSRGADGKQLHNALVATVVAWGAKFSENPVFVHDRSHNGGTSLLARTLVHRARELAEDLKVHRIPTTDHVVISLLIEPMQSQNMDDSNGFHGFWLFSAIRLLLDLQINHKSIMSNIEDPESRGTMIFAWWMACLSDAYRSVYYRRKPMLDDDDYDIDFYTVGPMPLGAVQNGSGNASQPSVREQLDFLGYYRSAHALARIARQMSRQLWRPVTEADGIPLEELRKFVRALDEWKDEYLQHVGVPANLAAEWDFLSAVSACASDATYHLMWIVLFGALDDFGIKEVNESLRVGSPDGEVQHHEEIQKLKKKVYDTALHGASRIAGLAGILTKSGYLRLDSAVMHVSIIQSGTLLARLGRPEVTQCIAGLEQYSYSYEECKEQAADISRIYNQALAGESDLNHMASIVPRPISVEPALSVHERAMNAHMMHAQASMGYPL